jgi:hypothetical protein
VVGPGDEVGGRPGQRDFRRVRRAGQSAEVDQESEVVVLVGLRLPGSEGGGDVPGDLLALALGMLGGHAADLAWAGQVGYRGAVPAGVDVRGAGHGHELINHQPPPAGLQVQAGHQRVGANSDAPDEGMSGHLLAGGQLHPAAVQGSGDRLAGAHLNPATPQHPVSGPGQPRIEFGQQPRGGIEQHPADLLAAQAGHPPGQPGREQLTVGRDLGTGITGAGNHEGAARLAFRLVGGHRGPLALADNVVPQVDRLGDAAEPVRVIRHARNGQQLVHAARGQDEPVKAGLTGSAFRAGPGHDLSPDVDMSHRAEHEPDLGHPAEQRDADMPRLDQPAHHLRHQRQVQEVIGRIDHRDLGRSASQPGQLPRGVIAGEAGSDDHDPVAFWRVRQLAHLQ